jgi:hypothetical protein
MEIRDLDSVEVLERNAMSSVTGGVDVKIDKVTTTIDSTDGGLISPGMFEAILNSVIRGLGEQQQRRARQPA